MVSKRLTQSKKIAVELCGNNLARFLYVALIPHTDREGRVNVNPHGLAGGMFEAFEYTIEDLTQALADLADVGLIELYKTPTHKLIAQFTKWDTFNKPHKREPASDYPAPGTTGTERVTDPFQELSGNLPGKIPEPSKKTPANLGRKIPTERNGEEIKNPNKGSLTGDAPDGGAPSDELEARLAKLPEGCRPYVRMTATKPKAESAQRLKAFTLNLRGRA